MSNGNARIPGLLEATEPLVEAAEFVGRHTPKPVRKMALQAASEVGAAINPLFDPLGNARNTDREAGA